MSYSAKTNCVSGFGADSAEVAIALLTQEQERRERESNLFIFATLAAIGAVVYVTTRKSFKANTRRLERATVRARRRQKGGLRYVEWRYRRARRFRPN